MYEQMIYEKSPRENSFWNNEDYMSDPKSQSVQVQREVKASKLLSQFFTYFIFFPQTF
jgi:hypothetical protein